MITTREQLYAVLNAEKNIYLPSDSKLEMILTSDNRYKIYRYLVSLRKTEYHYNNRSMLLHKLFYLLYRRKKNILGRRLGLEISENSFDEEMLIYHSGNIVVNGYARIGKHCMLHGDNCIGNNGKNYKAPVLGDRVRLCVGAKVIGDVIIADDVIIAAGAVVVESCLVRGAVLAGVPAKRIKVKDVELEVK